MTSMGIDLVLELERLVDALPERYVGDPYFSAIFRASAKSDDIEVARLAGMMIVELEIRGCEIVELATRWIELFGHLVQGSIV